MFTFFKKWLHNLLRYKGRDFNETIDSFGDPVAKEIEWSSAARCGCFYKNRKLVKNSSGDLIFYPSLFAIIFPSLFMAMGGYVIYKAVLNEIAAINLLYHPIFSIRYLFHELVQSGFSGMLLGFLFGLVFFMIGFVHLIYSVRPIVFKTEERMYHKGFFRRNSIAFGDIYAIQLLSDTGNGPDGQTSYEINLVLKSKARVNIFSHAKEKDIRQDADQLSKLLSVPVWDMM